MRKFFLASLFLTLVGYGKAQVVEVRMSYSTGQCAPAMVDFERISSNPGITQIRWDFGLGAGWEIGSSNAQKYYTAAGTYNVALEVEYNGTTLVYGYAQVVIYDIPHFSISLDRDTICPDDVVNFVINLTPPTTAADIGICNWNFGDGGTKIDTALSVLYAYQNGSNTDLISYGASLLITNKDGCDNRETAPHLIYVRRRPVVDFTTNQGNNATFCLSSPSGTTAFQFINQTDSTTKPPLTGSNTYVWNFGDGDSATTQNPTHTYGLGNFNVTLTATSPYGCTSTRMKPSVANIIYYKVGSTASDTVILCDAPSDFTIAGDNPNPGIAMYWNFGNGRDCFSSGSNPCSTIYNDEGIYILSMRGTHLAGCLSYDTVVVFVYKKVEAANIIDTAMCNPDDPVLFKDTTTYGSLFRDFGQGQIEWFFGDGGYAAGNPVSHIYGVFGEFIARQVVTTPYGCVLDTVDQPIHIFPLSTIGMFTTPGPPNPPEGCVPFYVCVASFKDSLKTTSPITDYIWRWDSGDNPLFDTARVDTTNSGRTDNACHTYTDTGIFQIWLTLINEQGCEYTVRIRPNVSVGVEPVVDWTYEYMQDCRSVFSVQVQSYDSIVRDSLVLDTVQLNPLIVDSIRIPVEYSLFRDSNKYETHKYGTAYANTWDWFDPQNPMAPIANGKNASLSFSTNIGYQGAWVVPKHNGCAGEQVQKDSIGYLCPPIAAIDYPKDNDDGTKPVFCEYPCFGFAEASIGAMAYEWYMGDTINGLRINQGMDDIIGDKPTNFNGQTKLGPLYWFRTWDTGEDSVILDNIQIDTVYTYDSNFVVRNGVVFIHVPDSVARIDTVMHLRITGDTIGLYPDTIPEFCYKPHDSLRRDPNFYIFQNGGVVLITMVAYNWDSTSNEYLDQETWVGFRVLNVVRDTTFRVFWRFASASGWAFIKSSDVAWDPGQSKWIWVNGSPPSRYDLDSIKYSVDSVESWVKIDSNDVVWDVGQWRWVWNGGSPPVGYNTDSIKHDTIISGSVPHPTYNRCKYCEDKADQVILISDAIMDFVADKYDVCQGDSIQFFDSTFCSIPMAMWGFGPISAAAIPSEHPLGIYMLPLPDKGNVPMPPSVPELMPKPPMPLVARPAPKEGQWVTFYQPNVYEIMLIDMCAFGCLRTDTITVNVWPRSIPAWTSSTSPDGPFAYQKQKDYLCVNNNDTLYLKDNSSTAPPFDTLRIVECVWEISNIGRDTVKGSNIAVVPVTYGLSNMQLTVTNEKGCDSTSTFVVGSDYFRADWVYPAFATPAKEFCNNVSINFINQTSVFPEPIHNNVLHTRVTCEWDWGDGTKELQNITCGSPVPNRSHQYNFSNKLTKVPVTLRVWMDDNPDCEAIYIDTLTIVRPIADFTDDGHIFPCPGSNGKQILFTDSSDVDGPVAFYTWHFGDHKDSTIVKGKDKDTVSHLYTSAGEYDVMLIVEDERGCIDTMLKPKHVYIDGPAGDFAYDPFSACVPFTVTFRPDIESGNNGLTADSVIWLPDGISPEYFGGYNVTLMYRYNFKNAGYYIPLFQMIKWVNNNGTKERCVVVKEGADTIWIIDLQPNFIVDSLLCLDVPVELINTTTVDPTIMRADSIYWNYGNEKEEWLYEDDVDSPNGEVIYSEPGTYTITLTEYYKRCVQTKTYDVEVMPWPDLYFFPPGDTACDGMMVEFRADTLSDLAASRIVKTEWRFDDSVTIEGNPSERLFSESNMYHYEVEITFTPKNCVKTWEDSVDILAVKLPVAEFSADPSVSDPRGVISIVETGGTIDFKDKSTPGDGKLVDWEWTFGLEHTETSTDQNPSHVFDKESGILPVVLKITDEYGCYDTKEHLVEITAKLRFPNVFTPVGSDGQKYVFKPLAAEGYFQDFKIDIYNKWGMLVWSQKCTDKDKYCPNYEDDGFWWDGCNRQGRPVPDGVYYWVVYAKNLNDKIDPIIKNGSITVINK